LRRGLSLSLLSFGLAPPAVAQQLPLADVSGQSPLQHRMGISVNQTCNGLAAGGYQFSGTPAQQDLFARCSELVVNAAVLTGASIPPAFGSSSSLGLNSFQLNNALLEVSDYKGGAVGPNGTQAAFVQVANLQQRFMALRDGDTGFSIAGLRLNGEAAGPLALRQDAASGDASKLPEGLGVFLTGEGDIGHFSSTSELNGFNYYSWGVTGGVDYHFTEDLVAGLAFGWVGSRADFSGSGGSLEQDTYIPSAYLSFTHDAFYADAIISYAYDDFDLARNIVYPTVNRTATGDSHGNEYSFSVGGGYEFDLKQVAEGLTAGPRARFDYAYEDIASFSESGANGLNLRYRSYEIWAPVLAVGLEAAYAISTGFGVLSPQLRVDYNHDFAAQPQRIEASFVADPNNIVFFVRPDNLDRDFVTLGVGLVATLQHGVSAFIDWESVLAYDSVQNNAFRLGARYAF
jgi:outer membrane autotransporter protein